MCGSTTLGQPRNSPAPARSGSGLGIDEEGLIDAPDDWISIDDPRIMEIAKQHDYKFGHAYLVAGEYQNDGEDECEMIIADAVVIAKLW